MTWVDTAGSGAPGCTRKDGKPDIGTKVEGEVGKTYTTVVVSSASAGSGAAARAAARNGMLRNLTILPP
jgi:hypothetical protein